MSRVAPSDTYKVYKSGSRVRIDTTLLGFDNTSWKRGNRSYIFTGDKECSTFIEIDRDLEEYSIEQLRSVDEEIHGIAPSKESIQYRLSSPVVNTAVDFENICFERNKSGLWGWMRSGDKIESINGYECKVFSADNINFVTRTRMDHLDEEASRARNSRTPLGFVLGISDNPSPTTEEQTSHLHPRFIITRNPSRQKNILQIPIWGTRMLDVQRKFRQKCRNSRQTCGWVIPFQLTYKVKYYLFWIWCLMLHRPMLINLRILLRCSCQLDFP